MTYPSKESVFFITLIAGVMLLVYCLIFFTMREILVISNNIHKGLHMAKTMLVYTPAPTPTPTKLGVLLPLFATTPTSTPMPTIIPTSGQSIPHIVVQPAEQPMNSVWDRLAQCESGNHWHEDTGNNFYGGLQFTLGTWASVGGVGKPSDASRDEQIYRAQILQSRRGWGPWPACSRKLGLL